MTGYDMAEERVNRRQIGYAACCFCRMADREIADASALALPMMAESAINEMISDDKIVSRREAAQSKMP